MKGLLTGEWIIDRTSAEQRGVMHYWLTILWFTVGLVLWIVLRHALWFVGFMSLYAIWITHPAGWAAATPVEPEDRPTQHSVRSVILVVVGAIGLVASLIFWPSWVDSAATVTALAARTRRS